MSKYVAKCLERFRPTQSTLILTHTEAKRWFIVSIAVPRFEYPRFQMGARTALMHLWALICQARYQVSHCYLYNPLLL